MGGALLPIALSITLFGRGMHASISDSASATASHIFMI